MAFAELSLAERIERSRVFSAPYRLTDGKRFRLKDIDPDDTGDLTSEAKPRAKELLALGVEVLAQLQERLYAQDRWAVLLIFQAMDAAGKDGAIKHVMSGVNPQGCQVHAFKAPSAEELDHDFLWRCLIRLPAYYEEVLAVRVHEEFLARQKLPRSLITKSIWEDRYEDIRNVERYLTRNGVLIRKFFLHVSKKEQKKRFLERLDNPEKNWKFSMADVEERRHWDEYRKAYEDMIRRPRPGMRPGTSCRRTTNGSRASSSPPRSSTRWAPSTCNSPKWTTPRRRSWPQRGLCWNRNHTNCLVTRLDVCELVAQITQFKEVLPSLVTLGLRGRAPFRSAGPDPRCLAHVARFKRYRLVEALPKNNHGKVAEDGAAPRAGRPRLGRRAGTHEQGKAVCTRLTG
jgi:PPK2 family polyphosphate:nucleotide phosphotransferase